MSQIKPINTFELVLNESEAAVFSAFMRATSYTARKNAVEAYDNDGEWSEEQDAVLYAAWDKLDDYLRGIENES